MSDYRLLSYQSPNGPRGGILVGDNVFDLFLAIGQAEATMDLFADWATFERKIESEVPNLIPSHVAFFGPLKDVHLLAPLLYPGGVFCVTANYRDHAIEMGGQPADKSVTNPYFFLKSPIHTVIGPTDPIRLPTWSTNMDWEAELAVVIGRKATQIKAADAKDYIAGYTIMHDVSARDRFRREDWPRWPMDWFGHKNFDGSAPMGPWITPAKAVADPQNLSVRLRVNEEVMQDSSTSEMIFDIGEQLEYLTNQISLRPGDVVATGTPAGCGRPKGLSLQAGDRVRIEIEGLGMLDNRVERVGEDALVS